MPSKKHLLHLRISTDRFAFNIGWLIDNHSFYDNQDNFSAGRILVSLLTVKLKFIYMFK